MQQVNLEEDEQEALFRWAWYRGASVPVLRKMYAIPNGGLRSKTEAARMQAQGVRRGVPDMFLPAARGGYHGLYIELKRVKKGRVSDDQIAWMAALTEEGYRCGVARGWQEAAQIICDYLDIKM